MENWKEYYNSHMMTTEEVVKLIESGDRIWIGNTCDVPYNQLDALADRYEELEDVVTFSNLFAKPLKMLTDAKYGKAFHHISYYPGPVERAGFKLGMVDYASIPYGYFWSSAVDRYQVNTVMIETSEPDEDGYINIGSWGCFLLAEILKRSTVKKFIAVVNRYIPAAQAIDEKLLRLPAESFAAFCRDDHPLAVMTEGEPSQYDKDIAARIMPYVHDGDVLQVGKGGLGNAIGACLVDKKDITVYSEILSDWVVALDQAGSLKAVRAAGCFGSQELYDFAETSPKIVFDTTPHLVQPEEISKWDNFVGINACMMVDLTGQSCSEGSGTWQYSAVGGQLDFVKGANKIRSQGRRGLQFLALRSTRTDKDGKLYSNIVVEFPPASAVTCPRSEAMYYATEYGVADLWGKTLNERVRAMIAIAHPDFREELKERAIALNLARPSDF